MNDRVKRKLEETAALQVDHGFELCDAHPLGAGKGAKNIVSVRLAGERRVDEPVLNVLILGTGHGDAVGLVDRPTSPSHLLVVRDRRSGRLVVDDEFDPRVVVPHGQCRGGDRHFQRTDLAIFLSGQMPRFQGSKGLRDCW